MLYFGFFLLSSKSVIIEKHRWHINCLFTTQGNLITLTKIGYLRRVISLGPVRNMLCQKQTSWFVVSRNVARVLCVFGCVRMPPANSTLFAIDHVAYFPTNYAFQKNTDLFYLLILNSDRLVLT